MTRQQKHKRLIDGVSEYGSALAKENEYPEPERTRESRSSRDWDIEL